MWYAPKNGTTVWGVSPNGETLIATVVGDRPLAQKRAEAQLLASAPLMLEALEYALDGLDHDDPREWVLVARDAVRIATNV